MTSVCNVGSVSVKMCLLVKSSGLFSETRETYFTGRAVLHITQEMPKNKIAGSTETLYFSLESDMERTSRRYEIIIYHKSPE